MLKQLVPLSPPLSNKSMNEGAKITKNMYLIVGNEIEKKENKLLSFSKFAICGQQFQNNLFC